MINKTQVNKIEIEDSSILEDGGVRRLSTEDQIKQVSSALQELGYQCVHTQASWSTPEDAYTQLCALLNALPLATNGDGFDDSLSGVELKEDTCLCLFNFTDFYKHYEKEAFWILDTFVSTSRYQLVQGRKFITLIELDKSIGTIRGLGGIDL